MKRILIRIVQVLLGLIAALSLFLLIQYQWTGQPDPQVFPAQQTILAHRGIHLNYQKGVYDVKTGCEAQHIFSPTHSFIENTLPSIGAAFKWGADIVEIDIRKTADSNLVVFHDYALDCRTNGSGLISEKTVEELKTLDIGYGYTADSGKTYPFRGQGLGLMSTLKEVLDSFPDRQFLIDHKDWDKASLQYLKRILADLPEPQRANLWFWSSARHQADLQKVYPEVRPLFFSRKEAKQQFGRFFFSFGLLDIPGSHHGRVMAIPTQYVPYLWGWPYRFIEEVHASQVKLFLMVDSQEEFEAFAHLPVDGFITDYIEQFGPKLSKD